MQETTRTETWLIIAVLLAVITIIAVRAPKAHCHDGSCHTHAAGVN